MSGNEHKTIGIATGICIAALTFYYGIQYGWLVLLTCPFGSLLPDIDHHATQLGKKRKKAMDIIKFVLVVIFIAIIALIWLEGIKSGNFALAVVKNMIVFGPIVVCMILTQVPAVQKAIKFTTKHRGIMHTLLVPVCLLIAILFGFKDPAVRWIVTGLMAGYLCHLFADSLTKERCPLLWPITTKPIGISVCKTETAQKVGCFIISGGLICLALIPYLKDVLSAMGS